MKELSSNLLGNDTASKYTNKETFVVDLDLKDLPPSATVDDIKKISGARHIISATLD